MHDVMYKRLAGKKIEAWILWMVKLSGFMADI